MAEQPKTTAKAIPTVSDAAHGGYQSKEALDASRAKPAEDDDGAEPQTAEIADFSEDKPAPPKASKDEDPTRMVKVRSRTFIPPFRYGPKMYTLPANKEVLVPLAVKRHLEEKQLL